MMMRHHAQMGNLRAHKVRHVQLNTDAYQTPPHCSQISCGCYSLGANKRIASSFYVFMRAHFIIPFSRGNTQRVMVRVTDTAVDEWQSLWLSF